MAKYVECRRLCCALDRKCAFVRLDSLVQRRIRRADICITCCVRDAHVKCLWATCTKSRGYFLPRTATRHVWWAYVGAPYTPTHPLMPWDCGIMFPSNFRLYTCIVSHFWLKDLMAKPSSEDKSPHRGHCVMQIDDFYFFFVLLFI